MIFIWCYLLHYSFSLIFHFTFVSTSSYDSLHTYRIYDFLLILLEYFLAYILYENYFTSIINTITTTFCLQNFCICKQNRNRIRYIEQVDSCQRGGGWRTGWKRRRKTPKAHRFGQQSGCWRERDGREWKKAKVGQMVAERDLSLGYELTMQPADDVL